MQSGRRHLDSSFQNLLSSCEEKMIACPLCTKVCLSPSLLNYHIVSHTKEKPHKCHICSAAFGTIYRLKAHIKSVHGGLKKIKTKNSQCSLCSYKCYDKAMLRSHLRTHSAEQPHLCSIPGCGFKTKHDRSLQQHVGEVHSNERPFKCPSNGCNYKAKSSSSLRSHLKIHSDEKLFACEAKGCNYRGKLKGRLKAHTFRAHSNEKPFKWSSCDYRGKRKTDLMRYLHRRFQCSAQNCGFASHHKNQLELRNDQKHGQKNFFRTAPRCNFLSGAITNIKKHLKQHQDPLLKCLVDSCNYSTRFRCRLLLHISHRHKGFQSPEVGMPRVSDSAIGGTAGAGALEKWQCHHPNCAYETTFPHHYDRHRTTHKEDENRKHVCVLCSSIFSALNGLTCHLASHTGEKSYRCSFCEYTTASSHDLRLHGRRIHRIHVIPRSKEDDVRKCGTCNMKFWSYTELILHSMSHLQPVVVLEQLKLQNL